MQYQFSVDFVDEIVGLALEIAFHQRGETSLQSVEKLVEKYEKEKKELAESKYPEEELPDILYYACCLAEHSIYGYLDEVGEIASQYAISQEQLEAITLAKYRLRAAGPNSKDFAAEREAIREALR